MAPCFDSVEIQPSFLSWSLLVARLRPTTTRMGIQSQLYMAQQDQNQEDNQD
jgi:hypothetical protein